LAVVSGSGITSMSLALMGCQPRMLEPSKPKPSSKLVSSKFAHGYREVLPHAGKIHKAKIDHFHALLFNHYDNSCR
jgi:purine nucleoside phosphorylase